MKRIITIMLLFAAYSAYADTTPIPPTLAPRINTPSTMPPGVPQAPEPQKDPLEGIDGITLSKSNIEDIANMINQSRLSIRLPDGSSHNLIDGFVIMNFINSKINDEIKAHNATKDTPKPVSPTGN